ncbi:Hsp20 family protein [Anoxybacteroides amylolyticum]|uniref:Hsp20/alpha crystallin family protein n=1 Tax=Anoxybacteroides amylolyticum TaxID=294699 RepID=A0A167TDI0_9BACL|nr:Hsp20/alpha crystallin family protein [Anoxybacillus amylolyticus]ANB60204.1 hsp20/alpha crystallin family protein [Anoxybacillus amylolyticus]
MSDHFQLPRKKQEEEPFQRLREMVSQFLDEQPIRKMFETLDEYVHDTILRSYIPIDVHETAREYIITAYLPNVNRQQIQLEFDDTVLHLTVHHREIVESADEQNNVYKKRRMQQQMMRTIPLPYPVKESEIKASFENGELVIRLPQKKKFIDIE